MGDVQHAGELDARQQGFDDGQYTTAPYSEHCNRLELTVAANPQILPEWLSYTTVRLHLDLVG